MMKYMSGLFFIFIFCISCKEQKQTNPPQDNNKSGRANYSEAQLKEAETSKVPVSMVRNVRQASNGDILIASYLGVFRYDASLPTPVASEGNNGVGLGTSFTNITSKIISPRFSSFWDVLEDRKGNLWLATRDSGVYLMPSGQTTFQHFTTKHGLASNYGNIHLYEDKSGNIWFGSVHGAYRYDARIKNDVDQGKSFRKFTTQDGLHNNDINTIMEDKTGKLWFGTRGDLSAYDGKTFTVLKNKDGKTFTNVWRITEDRKGNIWFGATIIEDKKGDTSFVSQGLWHYDGITYTKVSQKGAYAIIEDKNGNIWTTGVIDPPGIEQDWALLRYDAKSLYSNKPTVTEIMSHSGMLLGILEDDKGNIWFGSGGGVHRYDGKTITDFKDKESQK